ncbi:MAG: hypothetical protein PHI70_04475 [Proteiniphilum sp.]|nr:hypothetical protein [Proteiniphilum sp.]MDD4416023.1 hypothetical protein [Proteiniphilum sp.]
MSGRHRPNPVRRVGIPKDNGNCRFRLYTKTIAKMKAKLKELTSRSNGWGFEVFSCYTYSFSFMTK